MCVRFNAGYVFWANWTCACAFMPRLHRGEYVRIGKWRSHGLIRRGNICIWFVCRIPMNCNRRTLLQSYTECRMLLIFFRNTHIWNHAGSAVGVVECSLAYQFGWGGAQLVIHVHVRFSCSAFCWWSYMVRVVHRAHGGTCVCWRLRHLFMVNAYSHVLF